MKKIFIISLSVALLGLFASCSKEEGGARGFTAEPTFRINFGTYVTVPVTLDPVDAPYSALKYTSSDESVFTVDKHGTCFGVELGTATLTVEGAGKTAQIAVEVYETTIADLCLEVGDVTGLWEFPNDNPMKGTVGNDLIPYAHLINELGVPYEFPNHPYNTIFGDDVIPRIVPGFNVHDGAFECGWLLNLYWAEHGLTRPDTYTLLFDCLRPAKSDGSYTSFVGGKAPDNSDDQMIYLRKGGETQFGSGSNRSTNAISNDKWYRFVFVKKGSEYVRTYVNGELWNDGGDTEAAVLDDKVILINGDNDTDNTWLQYSTVAIFNKALSEEEIAKLGSI
ncbi:MAG: hypothetical protein IJK96_00310 [Bacteroidales bacterium]|nr:hypothetical protein [Bacteroidales bacterium]